MPSPSTFLACPHNGRAALGCSRCFQHLLCTSIADVIELLNAAEDALAECPDLRAYRESQVGALAKFSGARLAAGPQLSAGQNRLSDDDPAAGADHAVDLDLAAGEIERRLLD